MKIALKQARRAFEDGEVPIGAVLSDQWGKILSKAKNQMINRCDPTAHAEILAMREAACRTNNYRLLNTTLYVTVEPCIMCMAAIIHARVSKVVFGAYDPKWGGGGSLYNFAKDLRLNHHPEIINGVCDEESKRLLKDFFRLKRNKKKE